MSLTAHNLAVLVILLWPVQIPAKTAAEATEFCGKFSIKCPFTLGNSTETCWRTTNTIAYTLICNNNNMSNQPLLLFPLSHGTFVVREINYQNYTMRLTDPGISKTDCSSIPSSSIQNSEFRNSIDYLIFRLSPSSNEMVAFVSCDSPAPPYSRFLNRSSCFDDHDASSFSRRRYQYVGMGVGKMRIDEIPSGCRVDRTTLLLLDGGRPDARASISRVYERLSDDGFEMSFYSIKCERFKDMGYKFRPDRNRSSYECSFTAEWWLLPAIYAGSLIRFAVLLIVVRLLFCGSACGTLMFVYKYPRRHSSLYYVIEDYLQRTNNMNPIRYSFSDVKTMTHNFRDKLGQGGYGSVYKGRLRSGHLVAVKVLEKSKAYGQDFINEVSTIGRIRHVNVVHLVGFCAQGEKRALVYDFMPNGSLDKYIAREENGSSTLGYEQIFQISLGVARGIEYLHRGCDMQILHFDIKPHNILLDGNFVPKVADFGLAKLYPVEKNTVNLTAVRGTMGYIAPELFYRNIGGVSFKADIYSFGMMLIEIATGRRNRNALIQSSGHVFLPTWVYGHLIDVQDVERGEDAISGVEKSLMKKMIIVGLWCVQMKPSTRPSMHKVLEMLEGDVQLLQIPPKPYMSPYLVPPNEEQMMNIGTSVPPDLTDSLSGR